MQELRDYQAGGLNSVRAAFDDGASKVLMVMPTAAGKTTVFSKLASEISPTLILTHRRELVLQASNRLSEFGVEHGIIMAGEAAKPWAKVQIATVQTLARRALPAARLVVCDEAHLSTAKTWAETLDAYPFAKVLGVTATPWRLSGRPLSAAYDRSIVVVTPSQLRERGFLCPYLGFSYKTPDLSGVKTTAGEYNEQQSAQVMSDSLIVDNIVEQWLQHASHLSTVVFAVTVEHSRTLCERFLKAGVRAEHLDGKTDKDQRARILRRVETGETQVLCNVGVAVEGLDIPRLKCCVLARPTKSLSRAIQMMGRVRRLWIQCGCGFGWAPSKKIVSCLRCGSVSYQHLAARIHDHAFVIRQHGLPDAERDYSLDATAEDPPSLTQCTVCFASYVGTKCPSCSAENAPPEITERVLNTVADAEQFTFESGQEEALEVKNLTPVVIKWTGRTIEGVYRRKWVEPSDFGPRQFYEVEGKRVYHLPGTKRLDELMKRVPAGAKTRITQLEDTPLSGGRFRKEFRVEVDRG